MTLLQITLIMFVFYRALRFPKGPEFARELSW
jgi:hypothetical protein